MRSAVAALCAAALLCAACSKSRAAAAPSAAPGGAPLYAAASFFPMADFARKIAAAHIETGRVRAASLIPPGAEPHSWEPSPRDIAALERGGLFIYNGAGLEPWAERFAASFPAGRLTVVEASAGFPLIAGDPHVWLSPRGAKAELRNIAAGFCRADPAHAAEYEASLAAWSAEADALDGEYRAALEAAPRRAFITAHAAFGYLARDYGLEQIAADSPGAEGDASARAVRRAADEAAARGITTVFYGDAESRKLAEAIARETGGKAARLNPIESLTPEEEAAGDDYFSLMRRNLAALAAALREGAE